MKIFEVRVEPDAFGIKKIKYLPLTSDACLVAGKLASLTIVCRMIQSSDPKVGCTALSLKLFPASFQYA